MSHWLREVDTTTGNDDGLLCGLEGGDSRMQFAFIGAGAAEGSDAFLEEGDGIVKGFGLRVLTQRQGHGSAFGRVGQHGHGAVQRRGSIVRAG